MKFKRCDRCNREIEEKRGWAKAVEFLANAATQISAAMRGEAGDFDYHLYRGEEPADLCPDCQKSLQEWLKAGSKSQHQNEQQDTKSNCITKTEIERGYQGFETTGTKDVEFGKF